MGSLIRGIDCHAHVFLRSLPRIPNARYEPTQDAPIQDYLRLLDTYKLAGGVLVQPSFLGTDNTFLLDAVAMAPERLKAVAVVEHDAPPDMLDNLEKRGVVGVRLNFIGNRAPALKDVMTPRLIDDVVRRGWHIEVQAEGAYWPQLLPDLLQTGARLVIDHFGRPDRTHGPNCAGFQSLCAAARNHDIWFKLSAPYRFNQVHAVACASALLEAAGPDHLVWGSDWPWTQHPEVTDYGETLRWLEVWIPDKAVRDRILCENPCRLFGFLFAHR